VEDATDASGESITVIFGFWWMMKQILVENLQLLYSGLGGGCNRCKWRIYNCYIRVLEEDATDPSGESITVIFGFKWMMQQILVENL